VKPGKESGVSETGFLKKGVEKNQDRSFYILGYLLELIAEIWRFEFC
jgi:hypothetical protein